VTHDAFKLATWNILATSYIRREFYPNTPSQILDPDWRIPALVRRAGELGVDILCLQEVEGEVFTALASGLAPLGYSGILARKDGGKPDGCATFFRTNCCELLNEHRLVYADGLDGSADSGHIAQILKLDVSGNQVALVNTHLKWDLPHTPPERQFGLRQIQQALAAARQEASSIQLICGDFNATPNSLLINFLRHAGFDYTHRGTPDVFTCNSNGQPKLIDYVFFHGPVRAHPEPVLPIDGLTPLPSLEQPSDHLPLVTTIT
jgi:mRNA deadenylase 3'-5' endonuclease subunit Ccr4